MRAGRRTKVISCMVVASMLLGACGGDDESSDGATANGGGEPLIIGQAIAETGWMEPYDGPPAQFAQLAIDDVNAEGGILGRQVKTVTADTKTEVSQVAAAASDVLEKGAELVVTSCDFDVGAPAALEAQTQGVVAMSPCAESPKFGVEGIGPLAFTMGTSTPAQGAMLAEYAYTELGLKSAYIMLDDTNDYARTLCEGFKSRWIEIAGAEALVGEDSFKNDDASVATQISRLRSTDPKPEVIMLCSYNPGGASMIKQIRAAGIDAAIVSGSAMDGSYWLKAVPKLDDFYVLTYASIYGDDPNPEINELLGRYEERFGERPATAQSLTGYSLVQAFKRAAEEAQSTEGEKVAAALNTFDAVDFLGAGETTFSAESHINTTRPMTIVKVDGGKPAYHATFAPDGAAGQ